MHASRQLLPACPGWPTGVSTPPHLVVRVWALLRALVHPPKPMQPGKRGGTRGSPSRHLCVVVCLSVLGCVQCISLRARWAYAAIERSLSCGTAMGQIQRSWLDAGRYALLPLPLNVVAAATQLPLHCAVAATHWPSCWMHAALLPFAASRFPLGSGGGKTLSLSSREEG